MKSTAYQIRLEAHINPRHPLETMGYYQPVVDTLSPSGDPPRRPKCLRGDATHAEVRAYLVQHFLWISGGEMDYDQAVVLANKLPFCDGSSLHELSTYSLEHIFGDVPGHILHNNLNEARYREVCPSSYLLHACLHLHFEGT